MTGRLSWGALLVGLAWPVATRGADPLPPDGFELKVPEDDGSFSTTRPEYLQYYFGWTRRFAWPKGQ